MRSRQRLFLGIGERILALARPRNEQEVLQSLEGCQSPSPDLVVMSHGRVHAMNMLCRHAFVNERGANNLLNLA